MFLSTTHCVTSLILGVEIALAPWFPSRPRLDRKVKYPRAGQGKVASKWVTNGETTSALSSTAEKRQLGFRIQGKEEQSQPAFRHRLEQPTTTLTLFIREHFPMPPIYPCP
ncbi:hypothetical protein B0T14DRAFT_530888 [Immersiella caudata]|uniref:Secreted protein n=1 Tax=Immersiella caudata TaxID=314043 RepID=A0AA39WCV6_9PEZI|nr:hypothetical protein B0T14DRAFT_530888 [Immersiella caudata]